MDNTSKALLITAAVLIAIILIVVGIKIITSVGEIKNQDKEVGEMLADKSDRVTDKITSTLNPSIDFGGSSGGGTSTEEIKPGTNENNGIIIDEWNEAKDKPIIQEKNWYIYTSNQLKFFADFVNNNLTDGEKEGYPDITSDTIVFLMNDLNLNKMDWTPIGNGINENNIFKGTFDGQGHTISGINVNVENFAGLFGYCTNTIKNLTISDSTIVGKYNYVGAVAGVCKNAENCTSKNNMISGTRYVGGIIGIDLKNGIIKNCINESRIISLPDKEIKNKYNYEDTDSETGVTTIKNTIESYGTETGGIVGHIYSGTSIVDCVNKGQVESYYGRVGGIVGDTSSKGILITKCRNEGKIILCPSTDISENIDINRVVYAGGIVRINCN